jgi:SHAQKYF class myb-like DNA-binding protein
VRPRKAAQGRAPRAARRAPRPRPADRAPPPAPAPRAQPRYWTPDEHRLFMEAVQRYGWKDVKAIAQHVGTRTPTQVRTHAQKLLLRQQKEQAGVMQTQQNGRELPPLPPGMVMSANDGGQLLNMLGNAPAPAGDAEGISAGEPAAAPAEADLSALPPAPADAGSAAPVEAS